jgi:hypothetical protein
MSSNIESKTNLVHSVTINSDGVSRLGEGLLFTAQCQ